MLVPVAAVCSLIAEFSEQFDEWLFMAMNVTHQVIVHGTDTTGYTVAVEPPMAYEDGGQGRNGRKLLSSVDLSLLG